MGTYLFRDLLQQRASNVSAPKEFARRTAALRVNLRQAVMGAEADQAARSKVAASGLLT